MSLFEAGMTDSPRSHLFIGTEKRILYSLRAGLALLCLRGMGLVSLL